MKRDNVHKASVATAKLATAGATIFAIGWAILVLQPTPDEPVQKVDADIAMLGFGPKSDQQKFVDALMDEGLEKPRAYDHNGNKLFFSTTTTTETPRQVLARFQRAFVEQGLNDTVHLKPPTAPSGLEEFDIEDPAVREQIAKDSVPRTAWTNDYFGGIVPTQVSEKMVVMAGATTNEESTNWRGFLTELRESQKAGELRDLGQGVKAMRYMDAVRESPGKTRVTAVWSDDEYDIGKFANIGDFTDDLGGDPSVPVCPGCERLMHFKGETEDAYDNHAFKAPAHSMDQMLGYYREVLPPRGWKLSEADAILRRAELRGLKPPSDAQMLSFSKGARFLTVVAWESDGKTSVHVARSN